MLIAQIFLYFTLKLIHNESTNHHCLIETIILINQFVLIKKLLNKILKNERI